MKLIMRFGCGAFMYATEYDIGSSAPETASTSVEPHEVSIGGLAGAVAHSQDPLAHDTHSESQRLKPEQVPRSIGAYHGIPIVELTDPKMKQHAIPRAMGMHILVYDFGLPSAAAGRMFGVEEAAHRPVKSFDRRLQADAGLQRQRAEILDPQTLEREPVAERLMKKVCSFYGVTLEEVLAPSSINRMVRPRQVMAYVMKNNLSLETPVIVGHLQRYKDTIYHAIEKLEEAMEQNPLVAEEVAYIDQTEDISMSLNDRIMRRVSEVTGLSVEKIVKGKDAKFAQQMAMALMTEHGHMSDQEIAEYFGMNAERETARAETLMIYQQSRDPLLRQQLEWIREHIFSDGPEQFVYKEEAPRPFVEGEAVSLHASLPEIDERLVEPSIRTAVYEIVEKVAAFYEKEAVAIVGRSRKVPISHARRAAILLCRQAGLPIPETAICFGNRSYSAFSQLIEAAQTYAKQHPEFIEELETIAGSQLRPAVLEKGASAGKESKPKHGPEEETLESRKEIISNFITARGKAPEQLPHSFYANGTQANWMDPSTGDIACTIYLPKGQKTCTIPLEFRTGEVNKSFDFAQPVRRNVRQATWGIAFHHNLLSGLRTFFLDSETGSIGIFRADKDEYSFPDQEEAITYLEKRLSETFKNSALQVAHS